ncbi:MAG TPA: MBOAT family O-acyltransferase [Pelobium sp.]|nr:MBOAT family O-acyltransferase [Pelobium sp.]
MAFVPIYILILAFTIVIDYYAGIFIENASGKKRKWWLIISLIANVGVLCIFKYYNFLNDSFTFLMHGFALENPIPYLNILLPVGLSFHTFQAMSYTIEVYRGHQKAERHFGIYSLYVMFYPQLVAGPIERPQNLLHQFREKYDFDYNRITSGLRLMLWGLFKKVVIADRLAIIVDAVYNNPQAHITSSLIIATIFFAFQIFCDFSGYSDMAIGAARVMGFNLMNNFNRPYHSKSVHEFWSRWHISLSTWFKDYLYIPLGGNRVAIERWYLNIFIVFLVSGLWHGANWTFVVWGALHGFYIIFGRLTENFRQKVSKKIFLDKIPLLAPLTTFFLVGVAWVFFRADNLDTATYIITQMFTGFPQMCIDLMNGQLIFEYLGTAKAWPIFLIVFLETINYLQDKYQLSKKFVKLPITLRWLVYFTVVMVILLTGVFDDRQFIYFQF